MWRCPLHHNPEAGRYIRTARNWCSWWAFASSGYLLVERLGVGRSRGDVRVTRSLVWAGGELQRLRSREIRVSGLDVRAVVRIEAEGKLLRQQVCESLAVKPLE